MTKEITITQATPQDFDDIFRIFKTVVAGGNSYANREDTTREEAYEKWFASNAKTFIAKLNDKIVGTYLIRPNHIDRASHTANCSYIVDENCRGFGVGKKLGLHSIEIAHKFGYKAMQFNFVVSTNTAAVNLWKSIGFEIIGTIPKGFNHKDLGYVDAYIMHKAL